MKITNYLFKTLQAQGVHTLFLVPGMHIDPLCEALAQQCALRTIVASHELGAAYMADGYSRVSQNLGVVITSGGPGLSNLLTAVITARLEQSAMLVISGDVHSYLAQWPSFQNLAEKAQLPGFKSMLRVEESNDFPAQLQLAIETAKSAPAGPVHLQIPYDIQKAQCPELPFKRAENSDKQPLTIDMQAVQAALQTKRTAIIAGPAFQQQGLRYRLQHCLESLGIPLATSLCSKGVLDEFHPLALGNFGFAGTAKATEVMLGKDLEAVIFLGLPLNERNTLNWHPDLFASNKQLFCIGSEVPVALLKRYPQIQTLPCRAEDFVASLYLNLPQLDAEQIQMRSHWLKQIQGIAEHPLPDESEILHLAAVVKELNTILPAEIPLFVDAGSSKNYSGLYWKSRLPQRFWISAQMGAMGWGLCAAMGAACARQDEGLKDAVAVLVGDGSMLMHGLELSTAARYQLPLKIFLNNNQSLQSVVSRSASPALHDMFHLPNLDWDAFAASLGIASQSVDSQAALPAALKRAQAHQGCFLSNLKMTSPYPLNSEVLRAAYV